MKGSLIYRAALSGVLLATAAALTACGGDQATTALAGAPTVTSTVTTTTNAPSPRPAPAQPRPAPRGPGGALRTYTGTTDQGLPITVEVSGNSVTAIQFGWRARCEDGQVHSNSIALRGGPLRHDDFRVSGTLATGGVASVEGTVNRSTASGRFSRSKGSAFGTNCRAIGIGWRARLLRKHGGAPEV